LADGFPAAMTNTSAMDLILCQNVIMYFTREAQRATVGRLQRALVAGGWLIVSPAEASVELFRPLMPVNFPGAIFYQKESEKGMTSAPSPLMPSGVEPVFPDFQASSLPIETPVSPVKSPVKERTASRPDRDLYLGRARILADQGNLEEARRLCEAALSRDRLDPEAQLLFAAILQERGEIQAALEALRRAIYLAPDSASAHFLLGSLLIREGKRRRGRQSMETVVRLLSSVPRDQPVPGGEGLTAGRLVETARAYLESRG
jgi:chemotaxis protein methyltransferase CheR